MVLMVPPIHWVSDATQRASLTPLGRDQGIFQYIAWALGQGAVDYRDVRDVNGPLIHLVHLTLLALGGADEHRFRVIDLVVTGVTFAFVGGCLPGLRSRTAPSWLERVAWAGAGWVVLSGQYLLYGYWHIAQRESFCDWFMLPGLGLYLVALAPRRRAEPRFRRAILLAIVGALLAVPCFGKPTYALFAAVSIAAVAVADGGALSRGRAASAIVVGAVIGAATQLLFLVAYGDLGAFLHVQLVDVPNVYQFMWAHSVAEIFAEPWRASQATLALAGAVVFVALVAMGEMPSRVLPIALAPLCALAGVVAQAKGFPYHFHPVTATLHLQSLVFVAWLAERTRVAQRRAAIVRLAPMALAVGLALHVATAVQDSSYMRADWLPAAARTAEQRSTPEYFEHFAEPDFFPFELRQAAAYLRDHTGPADRVQIYGLDPYVLFLARRQSATPYIYAFDLNADEALRGGTRGRPDAAQAARIRAFQKANEADLLARLEAKPPAAFVFFDESPLLSAADAWTDFAEHCPRTSAWVLERYRETARFGHDHVWLTLANAAPELDR